MCAAHAHTAITIAGDMGGRIGRAWLWVCDGRGCVIGVAAWRLRARPLRTHKVEAQEKSWGGRACTRGLDSRPPSTFRPAWVSVRRRLAGPC